MARTRSYTCKIVHMTSVHRAEDTRILLKECRTLSDAGYRVVLVAQHYQDEVKHGVEIRALPTPRNRVERMLLTAFRVFVIALREKGDVYHFHDPELIPVGILLRLFGKKVVYDVHEDVPKQIMAKHWIPKFLRGFVAKLTAMFERFGSLVFDKIIAATPAIAKRFPRHKTVVVQNFPILGELVLAESPPYAKRPAWIAYVGGITVARGIREMVAALELLPEELGVRLRLAGKFAPEDLAREVQSMPGWEKVDYLGWQSRSEVAELLGNSRVGLVLFLPEPNHVRSQPNKLFEYMSAGIPVVASDFSLWREIVEDAACGLLVDPSDPQAIADAICYLFANPKEAETMGRNGRQAVTERYNWSVEAKKLISMYKELLP